jgi:hypothetical protein
MYVAVTALIIGQGFLFGSVAVLEYGAIVWAGFFLFVLGYEEPALGEEFPRSTSATARTSGGGFRAPHRGAGIVEPLLRAESVTEPACAVRPEAIDCPPF